MDTSAVVSKSLSARMKSRLSGVSIRSKLAFAVAFGFLVTFGVCFALLNSNLTAMSLEEQAGDEKFIAELLASQMQAPMQFKDSDRLTSIYQPSVDADSSLISVKLVHASGETLASYDATASAPDGLASAIESALSGKAPANVLDGNFNTIAIPVIAKDGATLLGVAAFTWNNGDYLAAQKLQILRVLAISAVFAVAGLVGIFFAVSRLVTGPIKALSDAMEAVADHAFSTAIPGTERQDEIGLMAEKLEGFRDQLAKDEAEARARQEENALRQKLFHHLGERMSRLADGKTDCTIDVSAFNGLDQDHVEICQNFNDVVSNLRTMLSTIVSTAESVRSSAHEISEVAEDQSKRSEAQAATLEESAAAIEELNNSVQKTARLALDANERIVDNKTRAATGGEVVDRTVRAMRDIEESSRQITAIIGVIDDIAFQTNLLALNAGVEAARAGDSGRGFAVVASEVRALAQRASDSANEIKELILRSSAHVTEGSELANQAGAALKDIIDGVNHVSDLVSNIATGSSEQATSLAEIKESVSELDKVTQQNAAVIEESSAASRSLSNEAQRMSDILRKFSLDELASSDAPHPTHTGLRVTGWENEIAERDTRQTPGAPARHVQAASVPVSAPLAVNGQDDWRDF